MWPAARATTFASTTAFSSFAQTFSLWIKRSVCPASDILFLCKSDADHTSPHHHHPACHAPHSGAGKVQRVLPRHCGQVRRVGGPARLRRHPEPRSPTRTCCCCCCAARVPTPRKHRASRVSLALHAAQGRGGGLCVAEPAVHTAVVPLLFMLSVECDSVILLHSKRNGLCRDAGGAFTTYTRQ